MLLPLYLFYIKKILCGEEFEAGIGAVGGQGLEKGTKGGKEAENVEFDRSIQRFKETARCDLRVFLRQQDQ